MRTFKKETAVIAGLMSVLILLAALENHLPAAVRFVVVIVGDLCACGIITLYCRLAARGVSSKLVEPLGQAAKLIFILLPIFISKSTMPLPQLLALTIDAALSGLLISKTNES